MLTILSLSIALIITVIIISHVGIFSLITGSIYFLFGKPKFEILRTSLGPTGFAFSFDWNSSREPSKFDNIRVRLFNPFGQMTQIDVSKNFTAKSSSFAEDVDFGEEYKKIINCDKIDKSTINVEVTSIDGLSFNYEMPTRKFIKKLETAQNVSDKFNKDQKLANEKKVYYHSVNKSFVAEQVVKSDKTLKVSTNPEFTGEFSAAESNNVAAENFMVAKVWIESGCIVCNACEDLLPTVFEVKDDGCVIRSGAPLDDGLKILESSEVCPVEIIKFDKAS